MSTVAYTDHHTHDLLDDALEQIARQRELNLASGTGLLSVLASMRLQITEMIEHAIAESDIGLDITIEDIADALGITDTQAQQRYTATDNHPF
ncbi:MAG: hypothetical protein WCA12_15190 [Burkholderiales bacterium]